MPPAASAASRSSSSIRWPRCSCSRAHPLDAVVLEVGLGGRLDAVNIVDADVAVLTSVALDHREWLGDTLEEIGREKAGIFRASRPAVLGSADMPQSVFAAAEALGTPLRVPGIDFTFACLCRSLGMEESRLRLHELPLPALAGQQQPGNAAAALAALAELRTRLPFDAGAIARGLRAVRLPGRFEVSAGDPQWILDVAHNPQAAEVLAEESSRAAGHRQNAGGRGRAQGQGRAGADRASLAARRPVVCRGDERAPGHDQR